MRYEERIPGDRPRCLLLQPTARHEAPALDAELAAIVAAARAPLAAGLLHVDDWDVDLMPWPDRKISRDERAGHCAGQTLQFIRDEVLPRLMDASDRKLESLPLEESFRPWKIKA